MGNAVVLAVLTCAFAHDRLFVPPAPALADVTRPPATAPPARRVLLVVIDGLRADAAADARLMPTLADVAQRGCSGTVRVESLIPSTIAGVRALATGLTAPPVATLQDFRSFPSPDGGIFARVQQSGGHTFVAGPRVWMDLYGRWINEAVPLKALVHGDDQPIVQSTLRALECRRFRLMVAHLGGPDDAAHLHGTRSPQYRAAVQRADDALRRLLPHVTPDDVLVVTSDHGNTDAGGHAGPEPEVMNVPLVIAGAGESVRAARAVHRQVEIAPLVANALAIPSSPPEVPLSRGPAFPTVIAFACCGLAFWSMAGARTEGQSRLYPTLLSSAVWVALALATFVGRDAAVGLAGVTLACVGWAIGRASYIPPLVMPFVTGVGLAAARLADGTGPTWPSGLMRDGATVAVVGAAYFAGRRLGRWIRADPRRAGTSGAATAVLAALALRAAGQTLSLSTLDVRWAYGLAATEATIALAVLAAAFVCVAPALALLRGLAPTLKGLPPDQLVRFAAGAGAVCLGQLLTMSLALSAVPSLASLATGGLLRLAGESITVFLALAAMSLRRREPIATPA